MNFRKGDTVFLEVTGEVRRYTAPLMRTAILGQPGPEIHRVASIVESTVDLILEKTRAGVKGRPPYGGRTGRTRTRGRPKPGCGRL